jgi:hypothetical protein
MELDGDANETYAVTGNFASGSGTSDMTVQVVSGNDLDTNGSSYTFEIASAGIDDLGNGFLNGEFTTCSPEPSRKLMALVRLSALMLKK